MTTASPAKFRITVVSGAHLTALDKRAAAAMLESQANSATTPRKSYRLSEADEQGHRILTQSYAVRSDFAQAMVTRTDKTVIIAK